MITIPLSTNLDIQSLLKSIQGLINLYNKDGNDISQHILVIDIIISIICFINNYSK